MTHHHHPGHIHPPAAIAPSMLRASFGGRLALAAAAAVLIWAAVAWALWS